MIALGLSSADLAKFHAALLTHHSVKITVQILDLVHNYLADVSAHLLDGQVNIDGDADITRSLTMTLRDPNHSIQLDSSMPTDAALFFDRMISVIYSVRNDALAKWIDVPIFCGPVSALSRTGDVINVEAMGKEQLVTPPTVAWYSKTWAKGLKKTAVVRDIMTYYGGETLYSLPDWPETLPSPVAMTSEDNIWALAKGVVGSRAYRHLFYDGAGRLCLRETPKTPTFSFDTGPGGSVLSLPVVTHDITRVVNHVRVKGAIPSGSQTPVTAHASLPRTHPLNAISLGRGGRPRVILEVVQDDTIKTAAAAKTLATSHLETVAMQAIDVKFDALVIPHLEPEDVYTISTPDFTLTSRFKTGSIPLKSARMSVGTIKSVSVNKTGIRR